jgi:Zn-dependent protease with chaperone function
VQRRERIHRILTIVALIALMIGGASPLFAESLASGLSTLLSGLDHVGALCLTALHLLLAPMQRLFDLLLAAGMVWAIADRTRAWRRLQKSIGALVWSSPEPTDAFWRAALHVGLHPSRVRVTADLPTPALTVGWLRPVVYVARELVARLDGAELTAVLAHETTHVRRRDPLRRSVLRFLAVALFWIPALRRLVDDLADDAELVADDHAAASQPLVLASALLALARWPRPGAAMKAAVGLLQADLLDRRIRRLVGEVADVHSRLTLRSAAGALAMLAFLWGSAIVAAHPLPFQHTADANEHCEHTQERPLAHLFCLGFPTAAHARCPHTS